MGMHDQQTRCSGLQPCCFMGMATQQGDLPGKKKAPSPHTLHITCRQELWRGRGRWLKDERVSADDETALIKPAAHSACTRLIEAPGVAHTDFGDAAGHLDTVPADEPPRPPVTMQDHGQAAVPGPCRHRGVRPAEHPVLLMCLPGGLVHDS